MNISTQPPHTLSGDTTLSCVLVPVLVLSVLGSVAAVVMYIKRRQRIDRLRHQLLPVYTYDPTEELNEAEQDILWKEEDTKVVQGWMRTYQQRRSLTSKDPEALKSRFTRWEVPD
ncbi:small integral membrane protein 29-like [Carassius carassius]|uniref:small integral membrane protein 29-like n=1 Tax=Carassius carassius TaxID=217509 RepID=UPI002868487C|nr:small integral membrane protein 29-like [Carassius carassius]XP_059396614.1 small integral membrane protein 29-like [Carassius carassius]